MKRKDYISWDEYFMGIAKLSAMRSKDPSTQVGACIVNKKNRVLSIGYNGLPTGCDDDEYPWERNEKDPLDNKYPYVVHAEMNAILNNRSGSLEGATIYVTLYPCNECAKAIIQSGIDVVIYADDKYRDSDECKASRRMFESAGVITRKLKTSLEIVEREKAVEIKDEERKVVLIYGIDNEPTLYYSRRAQDKFPKAEIHTHVLTSNLRPIYMDIRYLQIYDNLVDTYGEAAKFVFINPEEGFMELFIDVNKNKPHIDTYVLI